MEAVHHLHQAEDESFEVYKARVDSVMELLIHAKDVPSRGVYHSILLWNLQPRYAAAVLALKTSGKVTNSEMIDWTYIVQFMAEYERSQRGLAIVEEDDASKLRQRQITFCRHLSELTRQCGVLALGALLHVIEMTECAVSVCPLSISRPLGFFHTLEINVSLIGVSGQFGFQCGGTLLAFDVSLVDVPTLVIFVLELPLQVANV